MKRLPRETTQNEPHRPRTYWRRSRLAGNTLLTTVLVVYGVVGYSALAAAGELGLAAFIVIPAVIGAMAGYFRKGTVMMGVLAALAAVSGVVVCLVTLNVSGMFCGFVGFLIVSAPALVGVLIGAIFRMAHDHHEPRNRTDAFAIILLLPAFVLAAEKAFPPADQVHSTTTQCDLAVPVDAAWDAIVFYEEVEHEAPLALQILLPQPVKATGDKTRVGEIVQCLYDRGYLTKEITEVHLGRTLEFRVVEQHLHFERDVTLVGGSFRLEPTQSGSRIVLRTDYRRHLRPEWLWKPIEDYVVHTLHGHVLEGMRRKSRTIGPDPALIAVSPHDRGVGSEPAVVVSRSRP